MHNGVAASEAKFVVVTLSHEIQVGPDARFRKEVIQRLGVRDLFS